MSNFRVLHFEDKELWRQRVREMLGKEFEEVDYVGFGDLESFRRYSGSWQADIYIVDRHMPLSQEKKVDETSWKQFVSMVRGAYSETPVLMLSRRPISAGERARCRLVDLSLNKSDVEKNQRLFVDSLRLLCSAGRIE
jgi:CheY-like chemotaxis protein